jgi:GDP-L-fucose synthase
MTSHERIFVAGHRGLVGSAIYRRLNQEGYNNLIVRTHSQLDLCDQIAVRQFFSAERPDVVVLAAARVGGILANSTYPADFIYDNMAIQTNVIDAAYRHGVRKLLVLGSSCIYPRLAPQPIPEDALLCGALEPTNEWYAVAKIAGIKLAQAYRAQYGFDVIAAMPTNLYGPGDNFDLASSHVLPALMRKVHDAHVNGSSEVVVWGSGKPRREFLHVDDLADACVFLLKHYSRSEIINVGWGIDVSIEQLAQHICRTVGFTGRIVFDPSKPDGTPRKLLDVSRLTALGWTPHIDLTSGILSTYNWYRSKRLEYTPPTAASLSAAAV